jgi:hypothetical protein
VAGGASGDEAGVVSAGEIVMLRHRLAVAEAERDDARAQRTLESARAFGAERDLTAANARVEVAERNLFVSLAEREAMERVVEAAVALISSIKPMTAQEWNNLRVAVNNLDALRAKSGKVAP